MSIKKWERKANLKLVSGALIMSVLLAGCSGGSSSSSGSNSSFRLKQVNLVSDQAGIAAKTDPTLINAWGIAFGHHGRIWVNAADSGLSEVYDGAGQIVTVDRGSGQEALAVKVPDGSGGQGAPIGIVFSDANSFSGDSFVFAGEDGIISGWHGDTNATATVHVNKSANSVYKGLTSANTASGWRLFAANFKTHKVDVFDTSYNAVNVAGFTDPEVPSGYGPFNIQEAGGKIYVSYAQDSGDGVEEVQGDGKGYVSIYDTNGKLLGHLAHGNNLNAPWAIALAPADFGKFSGKLLIGNFGGGKISVYDPTTREFQGYVRNASGGTLAIDGLWGLTFGNDNGAGAHNQLFFSAGPGDEEHGLFGRLDL